MKVLFGGHEYTLDNLKFAKWFCVLLYFFLSFLFIYLFIYWFINFFIILLVWLFISLHFWTK